MITSIFYLILAILGLGFLIFIHELGHLVMARRVGMTVEVFSIGFGPILRQGEFRGVKWQLCVLPFGGYVRIAGMEKKAGVEPHQIPDGFYGKKPLQRIQVALAGPVVNIAFAFIAFCLIWASGGQQKPFQQYTHVIGYTDPQSKLYGHGIRPGDELLSVNGKAIEGYQDLLVALLLGDKTLLLQGNEVDYSTGKKEPFTFSLTPPTLTSNPMDQVGILPAQYLIFNDFSSVNSPLKESGIQKGDRILWLNGELIFSNQQLLTILNEPKALLTLQRHGNQFLAQVPRLKISDLQLNADQKNELDDWQHAAGLKSKVNQLYFIPYLLNHQNIVQETLSFMDLNAEEVRPSDQFRHPLATVLQAGDRIVAVDGTPVTDSIDLLAKIQARQALMIVQRGVKASIPSWKDADALFEASLMSPDLEKMISTIGSSSPATQMGTLVLLPPIPVKPLSELKLDPVRAKQIEADYQEKRKTIEKIENLEQREQQLTLLEQSQKRLMLGAFLSDRLVAYNPAPTTLFVHVLNQTWKTLTHLVTGSLSPKALAGPVGIVQALQYSWASGAKDALFWLGFVSLNLAFLNLLPIPVLDGGHIVFAAYEAVTRKQIKAKTMEKFIIPFLILLVLLFIYLTYQDIVKLIGRFF